MARLYSAEEMKKAAEQLQGIREYLADLMKSTGEDPEIATGLQQLQDAEAFLLKLNTDIDAIVKRHEAAQRILYGEE